MYIDSAIFLFLFLPIIIGLYFVFRGKWKNVYLFVINLFLYAFGEPFFIFLLVGSLAINYALARGVQKNKENTKAKRYLIIGIVFNLAILVAFKYLMAISQMFNTIIGWFVDHNLGILRIALPLGVSFYTFQAISYLVDVYKGEIEAEKNFIKLGVYFSFFATIVAGPIVRYKDIKGQIENRTVTIDSFCDGLKRFLIGLGQKIILANYFARYANIIFNNPANALGGVTAWVGVIMYTLQIYFDFAGYSSMAIGLAKMFGFELKENFDHPYISSSIKEFWRRWHISLSSWFRDYIYIPLGGNRKGKTRMYLASFLIFVLCGLWHGAALTYLVWGLWHGIFIVVEKLPPIKRFLDKLPKALKHIYTLLVVMVGWVFFRAPSLSYAFNMLGSMLFIHGATAYLPYMSWVIILITIFGAVITTPIYNFIKTNIYNTNNKKLILTFDILSYALLFTSLLLCIPIVISGTASPFIYAQF